MYIYIHTHPGGLATSCHLTWPSPDFGHFHIFPTNIWDPPPRSKAFTTWIQPEQTKQPGTTRIMGSIRNLQHPQYLPYQIGIPCFKVGLESGQCPIEINWVHVLLCTRVFFGLCRTFATTEQWAQLKLPSINAGAQTLSISDTASLELPSSTIASEKLRIRTLHLHQAGAQNRN